MSSFNLPYWASQDGSTIRVATLSQALIVADALPDYAAGDFDVIIESPVEAARAERLTRALAVA